MKIKIGNKVYDAENQPIMIVLNKQDKENIANMDKDATKYCCFPNKGYTEKEIEEFMNIDDYVELERM